MWKKTAGLILGRLMAIGFLIPAWIAIAGGRVKVKGYRRAVRLLSSGRAVILMNHPSLAESVVIPALFWPRPKMWIEGKIPWTVADDKLFGRNSLWLYDGLRCIPVNRDGSRQHDTARRLIHRLASYGNVIVNPEGGRTGKGSRHIEQNGRIVRECDPTPLRIAAMVEAMVIPVWVSYPAADKPRTMIVDLLRLWRKGGMEITFGEPVRYANPHQADIRTAELLLNCGLKQAKATASAS